MITNANEAHHQSLSRSDRLALWMANSMGTMACFYIFCGIGIGALVGILTGNILLGLGLGSFSSNVIQLVSLPILSIGQRLQSKQSAARADHQHAVYLEHSKVLKGLHDKIDSLRKDSPAPKGYTAPPIVPPVL